jgi:septum formation protein
MSTLYLASKSPRRRELLQQIHVRCETLVLRNAVQRGADVDEGQFVAEPPQVYVERVAREKAAFGRKVLAARALPAGPTLAADTVVILDGEVLGKPQDAQQAAGFLRRLAGTTHEVRTAIAIAPAAPQAPLLSAVSISRVHLRAMTDDEIDRYCATDEPYDKAGGYAIQGVAAIFVDRLEGSYSGVMGLPLAEVAALLAQVGVKVL